jgi:hypothetical protein
MPPDGSLLLLGHLSVSVRLFLQALHGSTTQNYRTWFDSIYNSNDVDKRHDSPKMGEEDVLNFEMLSNACPGLKQALKAFKGDSSLVKCFVGHVSNIIACSVIFMLNCQVQLSAAANSARAEDTSSCRKAVPAYILPSDHTDDDDLEKKSNRGWNNHYTARLLCPLKYLEEFDEDYEYAVTFVSMINLLTSLSFIVFSWARFSMELLGSKLHSGHRSCTLVVLCTIRNVSMKAFSVAK